MHNTLTNNLQTDRNIPGPAMYNDREKYLSDSRYKSNGNRVLRSAESRFKKIQGGTTEGSLI